MSKNKLSKIQPGGKNEEEEKRAEGDVHLAGGGEGGQDFSARLPEASAKFHSPRFHHKDDEKLIGRDLDDDMHEMHLGALKLLVETEQQRVRGDHLPILKENEKWFTPRVPVKREAVPAPVCPVSPGSLALEAMNKRKKKRGSK